MVFGDCSQLLTLLTLTALKLWSLKILKMRSRGTFFCLAVTREVSFALFLEKVALFRFFLLARKRKSPVLALARVQAAPREEKGGGFLVAGVLREGRKRTRKAAVLCDRLCQNGRRRVAKG